MKRPFYKNYCYELIPTMAPRGQPGAVPANLTTKDSSSSHTIPNNEPQTEAEVPERQVESDYDNDIEKASVAQLQEQIRTLSRNQRNDRAVFASTTVRDDRPSRYRLIRKYVFFVCKTLGRL
jgi:hypothetical protein